MELFSEKFETNNQSDSKLLGSLWNTLDDTLKCRKLHLNPDSNSKRSILSTVLLKKMDHKQVVFALRGIDTNHLLALCTVHCGGVCNRRSLGVSISIVDDEAGEARLTPALHRPPLLPGGA